MLFNIKSVSNPKIRIALVGCGRISKNHIKSILIHSDKAELVAICDNQSDRITAAQSTISDYLEELNLPRLHCDPAVFLSFNELLNSVQANSLIVDLVVLTTPSGLHATQAIKAANAGLHVCTEKPMATNWNDGKQMVKACDEAGVHLFVVKQNRFNSTLQLVKKQLQSGRFGKLSMVAMNIFWQRPQSYYDQDDWRGTWEFDGGALMNQASHYIDLLEWLIGPVSSVGAQIATLGRAIEVEDTAALSIKWRNGCLGTMAVTMLTYPSNLEGSITILGDKGSVKIGGKAVNEILHWEFSDNHDDDNLVAEASYQTTSVYGFGHPLYYKNILSSLLGKSKPECDGREGLKSLEILIAAYRSAKQGSFYPLPLDH